MNKKGNYSIPELWVWIFGIILILLFVFWMNNQDLNTRYKNIKRDCQELNETCTQLQDNYNNLKIECEIIKRDAREVLTKYLAEEILWEISGISRYRKFIEILDLVVKTY